MNGLVVLVLSCLISHAWCTRQRQLRLRSNGLDVPRTSLWRNSATSQVLQPMLAQVESFEEVVNVPTCVAENTAISHSLGTIFVLDHKGQIIEGNFEFTILSGSEYCSIGGSNMDELLVAGLIDYEEEKSFQVSIEVTDMGTAVLLETLTFCVRDLNDNAPYDLYLSNYTFSELVPPGTVIAKFFWSDKDEEGNIFRAMITGIDMDYFHMEPNLEDEKSELVVTSTWFNFEEKSEFYVFLGVSDGIHNIGRPFRLNAIDENNNPPYNLNLELVDDKIYEGQPAGTQVGTFTFKDKDTVNSFEVVLTGDTSEFELTYVSDLEYTLSTTKVLSYDEGTYRYLTIWINDGVNTVSHNFVLEVVNINNSPLSDMSLSSTTIPEDTPIGATVAQISFTDPDGEGALNLDTGEVSTYTALFTTQTEDTAVFDIRGTQLILASPLDYETKILYTLSITISDGVHESSEEFTITVSDVNDNPPEGLLLTKTEISVYLPVGSVATTFTFQDPDTVGSYTIELVEGGTAFALTQTSDFQADLVSLSSYSIADLETTVAVTISVSDGVSTSSKSWTLILINDNESPPYGLYLDNNHVWENSPASTLVGVFTFDDDDYADPSAPLSANSSASTGMANSGSSSNPEDAFEVTVVSPQGTAFFFGPVTATATPGAYQTSLYTAVVLDYESVSEYDVEISLVDVIYSPNYVLQLEETIYVDDIGDQAPSDLYLTHGTPNDEPDSDSSPEEAVSPEPNPSEFSGGNPFAHDTVEGSEEGSEDSAPTGNAANETAGASTDHSSGDSSGDTGVQSGEAPPLPAYTRNVCEVVDCGQRLVCVADDYSDDYACQNFHMTRDDEGNWLLLRRAGLGDAGTPDKYWHAATDNLVGSDVYGRYDTHLSAGSFSVKFDHLNFDEYMFSSGDGSRWIIVTRETLSSLPTSQSEVTGHIESSHDTTPEEGYDVEWLNRGSTHPEDPTLSFQDWDATYEATQLYKEASFPADEWFTGSNGANVYGRWLEDSGEVMISGE